MRTPGSGYAPLFPVLAALGGFRRRRRAPTGPFQILEEFGIGLDHQNVGLALETAPVGFETTIKSIKSGW